MSEVARIDGREVIASGTLVADATSSVAIEILGATITLVARQDSGERRIVSVPEGETTALTFWNVAEPLGGAATLNGFSLGNRALSFKIALYRVGDVDGGYIIYHYTIS